MGTVASTKSVVKQIRRAIGPELADLLATHDVRIKAHSAILRRGFFGRLKWLLFGQ